MSEFWERKFASRKFVDLIWKSSSKWAVWDPASVNITIGDYGRVDKETGCFEREGNIFRRPELADIVNGYETNPQLAKEDVVYATSLNARRVDVTAGFAVNAPMAQVALKTGWRFGATTGAIMVAHNPSYTSFPRGLDMKRLASQPVLDNMYLVTNVTTCPAYALYLASKEDSGISLALCAQVPVSELAGPEVSMKWVSEHGGGFFRSGTKNPHGYTVLFDLKRCVNMDKGFLQRLFGRGEGSLPASEDADMLQDASPPWGLLDEAGEEEAQLDLFADGIVT